VLVLGIIWQIIKIQLMSQISLRHCPELALLAAEGEDATILATLSPEEILLRWFNYHLANAGSTRRVSNFGSDLQVSLSLLSLMYDCDCDLLEL
jgi:plastin-1